MEDRADPAAVQPERPPTQPRSSAPRVRLSCESCRQRKVRCDKLSPCTSCVRLGFVCVPVERARLPRGRTRKPPERVGHTDKELADRVAKLEQLLRKVAERDGRPAKVEAAPLSAVPSASTGSERTERSFESKMADIEKWRDQQAQSATTMTLPHRPRPATSYLASSFWEDIMQQVRISLLRDWMIFPVVDLHQLSVDRPRSCVLFSMIDWKTSKKSSIHLVSAGHHSWARRAQIVPSRRNHIGGSISRPRHAGVSARSTCEMLIQCSRSCIARQYERSFAMMNHILTTSLIIRPPSHWHMRSTTRLFARSMIPIVSSYSAWTRRRLQLISKKRLKLPW